MGDQLVKQSQFTMPEMKQPSIGFNRGTREFFVQGQVFAEDDSAGLLESTPSVVAEMPLLLSAGSSFLPLDMKYVLC
jgi:hypothetical protein